MRIRKNKKLSSLICPPESVHDCRLNQSTWDAIPSPQQPYLHLQLSLLCSFSEITQFEYEDVFNGNGSIGDSLGAVESAATMVGSQVGGMVIDDNDDGNDIRTAKQFGFEEEEDKESNLLKSCSNTSDSGNNNVNPGKNQPTGGHRRGRARASGKDPSSASNPYEFYYYSGFGPSWGKKRRGGGKAKGPKEVVNNPAMSSSSQIDDFEEFDYLVDEEEEEEEEDSGKKRMRKPIKARSLKSLM